MLKWLKKFLKVVNKSGESSKNQQIHKRKCDICHKEFPHFTTHKCKHCSRIFCKDHKKSSRHNCKIIQNKKLKEIKLENVREVRGVDSNIIKKIDNQQDTQRERKKFLGYCEFCKNEVKYIVNRFNCPYCGKWHCEKHRLPEKHDCTGKPNPLPKPCIESYSRQEGTRIKPNY